MLGHCICVCCGDPGLLEYGSGDTLDYVEPCLPCASVSVENVLGFRAIILPDPQAEVDEHLQSKRIS